MRPSSGDQLQPTPPPPPTPPQTPTLNPFLPRSQQPSLTYKLAALCR